MSTEINLTYIRDFEHLLIVEGFLGLHDAWEIHQLRRVRRIADMKDGSSGV
jgi:hypothetical protein